MGEQHHRRLASGDVADSADPADRASVRGIDRNYDHHARQDCDRDLIHPRGKGGQAVTAGHAAERGADDVVDALTAGLRVYVAGAVSEIVEIFLGEDSFRQAHQRDRQHYDGNAEGGQAVAVNGGGVLRLIFSLLLGL